MQTIEQHELNHQEKKKISLYSVGVNLTLALIKIFGGLISGSAALLADGIHSLSDLAASLSVYVGIVISNKKYKLFPQGLYKVENLVALVSSFAIFFAGYEIAKDVLFGETTPIDNLPVALTVLGLTVAITLGYSRWEKQKAIELNSPSLQADAEHVKADFYTALVVLVGVLAQYFGYPMIEKLAVVVVIYFIFHSGFEILKEAIKVLLDASLDHESIDKIRQIVTQIPQVVSINALTGRNAGSYKFVQLDLSLQSDSLQEAHELAHEIEKKIKSQMPFVERVVIHYQPASPQESHEKHLGTDKRDVGYREYILQAPSITVYDDLARFLGTKADGVITVEYLEIVKMAGHSCATVAGAYLCALKGLQALYPDTLPKRGEIRVELARKPREENAGVVASVLSEITGATEDLGFGGIPTGEYNRRDLLHFGAPIEYDILFTRLDTGERVGVDFRPGRLVEPMKILLSAIGPEATPESRASFPDRFQEMVETLFAHADEVIDLHPLPKAS